MQYKIVILFLKCKKKIKIFIMEIHIYCEKLVYKSQVHNIM
jgi:hypothetical protein